VVLGDDGAIAQHAGRVVALALHDPRVADHEVDAGHFAAQPVKGLRRAQVELGAQQEILGRIAGERQLGKHDHVCALDVAGVGRRCNDTLGVTVDVADQQVDLRKRNAKAQ